MAARPADLGRARRNGPAGRVHLPGASKIGRLRFPVAEPVHAGDVRGRRPLFCHAPIRSDPALDRRGVLPAAPRLAAAVRRAALDRGPVAEPGGRDGGASRPPPPPTLTEVTSEALRDRLVDALAAATAARV